MPLDIRADGMHACLPQSLTPLVEGILSRDMDRFAKYAVEH